MRSFRLFSVGAAVVGFLALSFNISVSHAGMETGQVFVHAVNGDVSFSKDGVNQKVQPHTRMACGTVIRTGPDATVDLVLGYNRTILRLTPNSALRVGKLDQMIAGGEFITDTSLELLSGAVAGVQRKLPSASHLEIKTPTGTARIVGTEYYVSASGAVSVVSGQVSIIYNLPKNGGSVKVNVAAGYTFDPSTGMAVPTTPAHLQNILQHVTVARNNAETYKIGGATLVVQDNDKPVSPVHGNNGVGNGQDPPPPGNPPVNDGPGTGPGNPGNGNGNGNGRN